MRRALPLRPSKWLGLGTIVMLAAAVSVNAADTGPVAGPLRPDTYLDPFLPVVGGGYLLCHSSCSNPYGVDDLHAIRIILGARFERTAIWAIWDSLTHPLYRLDVVFVRVCAGSHGFPLSLALEPILRREAVKGFPAVRSNGMAGIMVLRSGGCAISLRRRLGDRSGESSTRIVCSARMDRFEVAAAGRCVGGDISLVDVEGDLELAGTAALRTGYRLDSDEIRCGLVCRRKGLIATVLWSHHPVLGGTVTLGVGCVWER